MLFHADVEFNIDSFFLNLFHFDFSFPFGLPTIQSVYFNLGPTTPNLPPSLDHFFYDLFLFFVSFYSYCSYRITTPEIV